MFAFLNNARSTDMPVTEAVAKAKTGEIVLIDIREPMEIAHSGKAKGAIAIPTAALRMRADPSSPECLPELKQGKPVCVYCASGARSSMAKGMLSKMGHEVHNIGGLGHWVQAGGPLEK
ncbi:rhodanese-like domain-containing protein [Tropicibacter naphthalenivorans]|nr:rhodanese-like domain-containing protein [Tropicibacter naphthalenivorans]